MQDSQKTNNCCFPNQIQPVSYPNNFYSLLNEINQISSSKIFWLIASASSLGITGLWQQNAQAAKTPLRFFPGGKETFISELAVINSSSESTTPVRDSRDSTVSISLNNVESKTSDPNHNDVNSDQSLPLAQPSFSSDLQQNNFEIPQLPSLAVNTAEPGKETKNLYTVKAGDTIVGIAREHGISSKQIIRANRLTNPNFIKVNRKLIIPSQELNKSFARSVAFKNRKYSLSNNFVSPELTQRTTLNFSKNSKSSKYPSSQDRVDIGSQKSSVSSTTNDHYISKLRQDIVRLRSEYQQQFKRTRDLTLPISTPQNNKTAKVKTRVEDSTSWLQSKDSVNNSAGIISSSERSANPLAKSVNNFALVPELPPLASPEEYLPSNPTFNGYIWPAQGNLTSGYGWRWGRLHKGIDIAAPIGTPIVAAAPGKVIFAGWNSGGYGNLVKLKHEDGSVTLYAHNNRLLIRPGQKVKQGQLIAEMGSTGRSSGPHLHFEIRPNGSSAINPIARLPKK